MIARHLTQGTAKFEAFNTGYVKMLRRRPQVDHEAIKGPLDRFISCGLPEFDSPVLVTKTVYDQAAELIEFATDVLGTRH